MGTEEFNEKSEEITGEKVLSMEDKIQQGAEKLTKDKKAAENNTEETPTDAPEENSLEQRLMSKSTPEEAVESEEDPVVTETEAVEEKEVKDTKTNTDKN